jgi:DnaJ-class molecular chaperone
MLREAYAILSDADSRAFYDKVGKAGMNKTGENAEVDPGEIFASMFGGGEPFVAEVGCQ